MSPQEPAPPAEAPVDPLYTHPASPFIRTEAPTPVAFASPPSGQGGAPISTWSAHKTQIQFAFAILAFLMILVGSVTVVDANAEVSWKFGVAAVPVLPAAIVIWLFVRTLARLDEVQKRVQVQALGFAVASTALVTFAYGFFEGGGGLPAFNGTFVLPLMALLWGVGMIVISVRYRFRR